MAMIAATACALAADGAGRPAWRLLLAPIVAGAGVVPFASPAGRSGLCRSRPGCLLSRLRHGARPVGSPAGFAAGQRRSPRSFSRAGSSALVAARIRTRAIPATSRALGSAPSRWASGPPRDFRFDPSRGDAHGPRARPPGVGAVWGTLAIVRARAMAVAPPASAQPRGRRDLARRVAVARRKGSRHRVAVRAVPGLLGFSSLPSAVTGRRAGRSRRRGRGGRVVERARPLGGVSLAPRAQLAELERDRRRDRRRRADADDRVLALRRPPLPARRRPGVGLRAAAPVDSAAAEARSEGAQTDTDLLDPDALGVYRTLVLRRSPAQSRPPSPYRLVWRGEFYEAWQRPADPCRASERLAAGVAPTRSADPAARRVSSRALAAPGAGARVRVVAADRARRGVPSARSSEAEAGSRGPSAGLRGLAGRLGKARRLSFWWTATSGEVRHELNNSGRYVAFGEVALAPGGTGSSSGSSGADLHPGSGGSVPLGPIALTRGEAADSGWFGSGCRRRPALRRAGTGSRRGASARSAPDPPDHQGLERQPGPERPARDAVQVEAPDLLGADRHVNVRGEHGDEQCDQPPPREAACRRRDHRERARDLGVARVDDGVAGRDRDVARDGRLVLPRDHEVHDAGEGEERGEGPLRGGHRANRIRAIARPDPMG